MKRSGDSPLNCLQVIPAASVTSVKISPEFTAAVTGRRHSRKTRQTLNCFFSAKERLLHLERNFTQSSLTGDAFRLQHWRRHSALRPPSVFCGALFLFRPLPCALPSGKRGQEQDGPWRGPARALRRFAVRSALHRTCSLSSQDYRAESASRPSSHPVPRIFSTGF